MFLIICLIAYEILYEVSYNIYIGEEAYNQSNGQYLNR